MGDGATRGFLRSFGLLLVVAALGLSGCSSARAARPVVDGRPLRVVAAEATWGSVVAQVGGSEVAVTTLISSPGVDPHDYEPSAADARAVADADLLVVNGLGYDPWAQQLADADGRVRVLDLGAALGHHAGENPHRWYSPSEVHRAVHLIAEALASVAPGRASSLQAGAAAFEDAGLHDYDLAVAALKARPGGSPRVGATESVVVPLTDDLGWQVLPPPGFLAAVAEGVDPSARDKAVVDAQIAGREIDVLLVNVQNRTPDVDRLVRSARAVGVPVVEISESPRPAGVTFQAWQAAQLRALDAALGGAGA